MGAALPAKAALFPIGWTDPRFDQAAGATVGRFTLGAPMEQWIDAASDAAGEVIGLEGVVGLAYYDKTRRAFPSTELQPGVVVERLRWWLAAIALTMGRGQLQLAVEHSIRVAGVSQPRYRRAVRP